MRKPFARICFAQMFCTDFCTDFLDGSLARIVCTDCLHRFSVLFFSWFLRGYLRGFIERMLFCRDVCTGFCTDFLHGLFISARMFWKIFICTDVCTFFFTDVFRRAEGVSIEGGRVPKPSYKEKKFLKVSGGFLEALFPSKNLLKTEENLLRKQMLSRPSGSPPLTLCEISRGKTCLPIVSRYFWLATTSPNLSPKRPPKLSLPHKRGLFFSFKLPPLWGQLRDNWETKIVSRKFLPRDIKMSLLACWVVSFSRGKCNQKSAPWAP